MKKIFSNIVISIVAVVLIVFFLEVALRLTAPLHFTGFTDAYQYDSDLGYRAMPGHHLSLTDYQQELQVNHYGTINYQENFREYKNLIFAVGDSYTQGTGLYSDASYPFQLDLMLNIDRNGGKHKIKYSKEYGVVNLGLAAYGAEQEYLVLKRYISLIGKPDIVLYMGCDNDATDDALFRSGIRHKNIVKGNPEYGALYYPINFIFNKTETGKRIRYIIQEKIIRKSAKKESMINLTNQSVAQRQIDVINKIIDLAKNNNSKIILSWAETGHSYEWLKQWSHENNIAFADWQPVVNEISNNLKALEMKNPHSGRHYRTWVNSMVALSFKHEIEKIRKAEQGE